MTDSKNTEIQEVWRDIPEYAGWYQVSDHGRVRRVMPSGGARAGRILKQCIGRTAKYFCVDLYKKDKGIKHLVHKLVAESFIGPRPEGYEINHKDLDKLNNNLDNLEFITKVENSLHAGRAGKLSRNMRGESNSNTNLTSEIVLDIRRRYAAGGITYYQLADEFGLHHSSIAKLVRGVTWPDL